MEQRKAKLMNLTNGRQTKCKPNRMSGVMRTVGGVLSCSFNKTPRCLYNRCRKIFYSLRNNDDNCTKYIEVGILKTFLILSNIIKIALSAQTCRLKIFFVVDMFVQICGIIMYFTIFNKIYIYCSGKMIIRVYGIF